MLDGGGARWWRTNASLANGGTPSDARALLGGGGGGGGGHHGTPLARSQKSLFNKAHLLAITPKKRKPRASVMSAVWRSALQSNIKYKQHEVL